MKIQGNHLTLFGTALLLAMSLAVATPALGQGSVNLDREISLNRSLLDADSGNSDLRLQLVKLYFIQGARHLETGNNSQAINSLAEGVRVIDEGAGQISDREDVVHFIEYATAHATNRLGRTQEAVSILDNLAAAEPGFHWGRYMLAAILMQSRNEQEFTRGFEAMRQLYRDADGELRGVAAHAAANLGYARAIQYSRSGRTGDALTILVSIDETYGGARAFMDDEQGEHFNYALGRTYDATGDTEGAVVAYRQVYNSDPGYPTGGTTITSVLDDAHYKRALELLVDGSPSSGAQALDHLDEAAALGGASVDVEHGRYLAYLLIGDQNGADSSAAAIREMDPAYFASITQ